MKFGEKIEVNCYYVTGDNESIILELSEKDEKGFLLTNYFLFSDAGFFKIGADKVVKLFSNDEEVSKLNNSQVKILLYYLSFVSKGELKKVKFISLKDILLEYAGFENYNDNLKNFLKIQNSFENLDKLIYKDLKELKLLNCYKTVNENYTVDELDRSRIYNIIKRRKDK